MTIKNIVLRSQSEKTTEMSKIGKSTETEKRLVFALGWKEREMGNDS